MKNKDNIVSFVTSTTFEDCYMTFRFFTNTDTPMYVTDSTEAQKNKSYAPDKIGHGKKMAQIPIVLQDWINSKQFCKPGVSIKSVAKEIGINSNYLSRYLNGELNITFQYWLHTLRIEEAKTIMSKNPKIKLYTVAKAIGISKIYNFSRWFKNITGITANEWRTSHIILNTYQSEI